MTERWASFCTAGYEAAVHILDLEARVCMEFLHDAYSKGAFNPNESKWFSNKTNMYIGEVTVYITIRTYGKY